MFASLKNKIREETGNDISKLTQKITSTTAQKIESLRGKSHQGSTSSINSIVSSDGVKEDGSCEEKKVADFAKRLEEKEREWKELMNEKDKKLQNAEKEKNEAYKQINKLKESLKIAEGILLLLIW